MNLNLIQLHLMVKIEALKELNIDIIAVSGTSIGAINGAMIVQNDIDKLVKRIISMRERIDALLSADNDRLRNCIVYYDTAWTQGQILGKVNATANAYQKMCMPRQGKSVK